MTPTSSTTPPAGWFPDPGQPNQLRYWDGQAWTEHRAPGASAPALAHQQNRTAAQDAPAATSVHRDSAATPAAAAQAGGTAGAVKPTKSAPIQPKVRSLGPPPAKPVWYRRTWAIVAAAAVVALLVGVGIGAASVGVDPKNTPEYKALAADLSKNQSDLDATKADLAQTKADAEAALGDLPAREDALKADQNQLKADQAALDTRAAALTKAEKAVTQREKAVGIIEDKIAANTVAGDGMYKVGDDMAPGTYKTAGKRGCYYAVLNSTDTFDIAVNGNPDGPAFATISNGQYFEVSGCADWVLQN